MKFVGKVLGLGIVHIDASLCASQEEESVILGLPLQGADCTGNLDFIDHGIGGI